MNFCSNIFVLKLTFSNFRIAIINSTTSTMNSMSTHNLNVNWFFLPFLSSFGNCMFFKKKNPSKFVQILYLPLIIRLLHIFTPKWIIPVIVSIWFAFEMDRHEKIYPTYMSLIDFVHLHSKSMCAIPYTVVLIESNRKCLHANFCNLCDNHLVHFWFYSH